MKFRSKIIPLLWLCYCSLAIGQDDTTNLNQFIGDWHGEGHFYNTNMDSEAGNVRFTLRITPDMEITGMVGNAEFIDAEIEVDNWNNGYSIKGTVVGQIFPNSDFHKKYLILLLNEVQDDITVGDFHLASNFFFDFSMRPGALTLRRNP